jgi:hypothetical protein
MEALRVAIVERQVVQCGDGFSGEDANLLYGADRVYRLLELPEGSIDVDQDAPEGQQGASDDKGAKGPEYQS